MNWYNRIIGEMGLSSTVFLSRPLCIVFLCANKCPCFQLVWWSRLPRMHLWWPPRRPALCLRREWLPRCPPEPCCYRRMCVTCPWYRPVLACSRRCQPPAVPSIISVRARPGVSLPWPIPRLPSTWRQPATELTPRHDGPLAPAAQGRPAPGLWWSPLALYQPSGCQQATSPHWAAPSDHGNANWKKSLQPQQRLPRTAPSSCSTARNRWPRSARPTMNTWQNCSFCSTAVTCWTIWPGNADLHHSSWPVCRQEHLTRMRRWVTYC